MTYLHVAPSKIKVQTQIPEDIHEVLQQLLAFYQATEYPQATLDHVLDAALRDYIQGRKAHMKALKAWQDATQEQPEAEKASKPLAPGRTASVDTASPELDTPKPKPEDVLQRIRASKSESPSS